MPKKLLPDHQKLVHNLAKKTYFPVYRFVRSHQFVYNRNLVNRKQTDYQQGCKHHIHSIM
jgi:hypothetical protein